MERLTSTGRLTLLVRQLERIGRDRVGLGDRVDEAVVRRERRVRAEAAVASPVLFGLVGVGGFGDMSEPSEKKKQFNFNFDVLGT